MLDLTAMGLTQMRQSNQLLLDLDDWRLVLEAPGADAVQVAVEREDEFLLVHFDLPAGPLGEYHLNVQQALRDTQRSWVGALDCWRGSELTSLALNYSFNSAANLNLPVVCNYQRHGENRSLIALLDAQPRTEIHQRPIIEQPPMHLLQTRFSRRRRDGGFRETLILGRQREHFTQVVQRCLQLCRRRQHIVPLPAPAWAFEPVWCSWYSHLYQLTQQDVLAQIPELCALGIRTVILDASWFKQPEEALHRRAGDYTPQQNLLPDLQRLVGQLHQAGLRVMLWCAPHFVGIHSSVRAALESACVWDGAERGYRLCPACPESIAHAQTVVARLMRDYDLDGLKLDFLDQTEPACVDPTHPHPDGEVGPAMARFMNALRESILQVRPDAAIEYRISYSTLPALAAANCHRGNDAPYDADYIRRENLFLRLYCPSTTAVWSDYAYWHPNETAHNVGLMLGQQIFSGGVPTLSLNLPALDPDQRQMLEDWLRFYRTHRAALARAVLQVHSADSCLSVTSLVDHHTRTAYLLLAGQHVPRRLTLDPQVRQVWLLNASAEAAGRLELHAGSALGSLDVLQGHVQRLDLHEQE